MNFDFMSAGSEELSGKLEATSIGPASKEKMKLEHTACYLTYSRQACVCYLRAPRAIRECFKKAWNVFAMSDHKSVPAVQNGSN